MAETGNKASLKKKKKRHKANYGKQANVLKELLETPASSLLKSTPNVFFARVV